MLKDLLPIHQFAKKTGVTARALRLYEEMGLIDVALRGENGYRYYRTTQIPIVQEIRSLKSMGFSLLEIKTLMKTQSHETLSAFLKQRREKILLEQGDLKNQLTKIDRILSSMKNKKTFLNEKERGFVMDLFKRATIVVTGIEDLQGTAEYIKEQLTDAQVLDWKQASNLGQKPTIVLLPEKYLTEDKVKELRPDVVVIKNVGDSSPQTLNSYLGLYAHVGPHMATVLNADDRLSIEIAKKPQVQKGKIYYHSKNSGLKDQIEEIGGIVSDGEELQVFGFNRKKPLVNIKLSTLLPHHKEVALLAALAATMDLGLNADQFGP